jgi:hypothetical protein
MEPVSPAGNHPKALLYAASVSRGWHGYRRVHFPVRWVRVGALCRRKLGVRKLLSGEVDAPGATVRRTEATMRATRRGSIEALGKVRRDWNQCRFADLRLRDIHQRIRDPDEMVSSDPS